MATQLLLEGPSLETLLEQVHAEHGPKARIVSADRLRRGGLAGFFSKPWFEIGVELPGTDAPTTEAAAAAPATITVDALLNLADSAERAVGLPGSDARPAEVAAPAPATITVDALLNLADVADSAAVSAPSFGAVLAEATGPTAVPAPVPAAVPPVLPAVVAPAPRSAPRSEPKPAPWTIMDPAPAEAKPEPTPVTPKPAARAAKPSARRASGPQLIADLPTVSRPSRRTPAPRPVADLTPAIRSTQRAAARRTSPLTGEPIAVAPARKPKRVSAAAKPATPAPRKKTSSARVTVSVPQHTDAADFSDVLVALPGRVVMVAGELPWALDVAGWVCRRMRIAPGHMLVAGPDGSGNHRRVNGPEHAATLAAELHAGDAPVVVVVDAPVSEPDGGRWAAAMADALGADAVIAVVDATRKTADLRRHLHDLGTVRAMAVYAVSATADPATVLELGVPVMLVDGQPVGAAGLKPALLSAH